MSGGHIYREMQCYWNESIGSFSSCQLCWIHFPCDHMDKIFSLEAFTKTRACKWEWLLMEHIFLHLQPALEDAVTSFVFLHPNCFSSNKSTSSAIYLFLPLGSWLYNLLWAGKSLYLCEPRCRNHIGIAQKIPIGIGAKYRWTHMPVCHHEQNQHKEWALFLWFQLTQEFPEGKTPQTS